MIPHTRASLARAAGPAGRPTADAATAGTDTLDRVIELTQQVRAFLTAGTRTAKLAWSTPDGRALVAPVWFVLDGDQLLFMTGERTAKGRAIARDPRLTLCVDYERPPYAFVQLQGTAAVSTDPEELLRVATAIGARYMGSERAEEFGRRNGVPGELLVRLTLTKVIANLDVTG